METRIPTSVYRLQFNFRFTFSDATDLVDYFDKLGITDCFASPMMKSTPGSLHNYDVTDHSKLNTEIGSEKDLHSFGEKLHERGMGMIMDLIPNHMCISVPHNPWWNDILENGQASPYDSFFNIDWEPLRPELKNKVLLPFLDQQFGRVLENKELQIVYENKAFFVKYFDSRYPTDPKSWNLFLEPIVRDLETSLDDQSQIYELLSIITALKHLPSTSENSSEKIRERLREKEVIKNRLALLIKESEPIKNAIDIALTRMNGTLGAPHTFDQLEQFLSDQPYRLSHWRVAHDEINYRRFFDVSELAGIRPENPKLFSFVHHFPLTMIQRGWVTGFRIDHVDGLFNPDLYLRELQWAAYQALYHEKPDFPSSSASAWFYIVVEKILSGHERLRKHWPIFGTSGYDFLNLVTGIFVDTSHKERFLEIYRTFTHLDYDPSRLLYESKRFILKVSMSSELQVLARRLDRISEQHRYSRDFTLQSLIIALRSVMANLSIYRTYISAYEKRIDEEDRGEITSAVEKAKTYNPALSSSLFDFIKDVLLLNEPPGLTERQREERNRFVMRFQQLTGHVMAKGLEDTSFYRFYPLASLNEVGADLGSFGIDLERFHQENIFRLQNWPHSFLTTSTHDTKRSEDVRARMNVLSEIPKEWSDAIHRWELLNREKKKPMKNDEFAPDRNEEYLIYQTLVGAWPLEPMDDKKYTDFVLRIDQYINKAMKEAKIHTSWINPNMEHDLAVREFIHEILLKHEHNPFLPDLEQFIFRIRYAGVYNSLSQLVLKITSPGVPDFYQGNELWSFTLVDPDNRSPVDYSIRKKFLKEIAKDIKGDRISCLRSYLTMPEDGKIKMIITQEALHFRKEHIQLFSQGDYIALVSQGERKNHIIAFSRVLNHKGVVVICGRFFGLLSHPSELPLGVDIWQDTTVEGILPGKYRDIFTHRTFETNGSLPIAEIFSDLPFSILSYES